MSTFNTDLFYRTHGSDATLSVKLPDGKRCKLIGELETADVAGLAALCSEQIKPVSVSCEKLDIAGREVKQSKKFNAAELTTLLTSLESDDLFADTPTVPEVPEPVPANGCKSKKQPVDAGV